MVKEYTCVLCPNSCELLVEIDGSEIKSITGNTCPKGRDYAIQEALDPRRTIATSVRVLGGNRPLVSVRLTAPIRLADVKPLMEEIKNLTVHAPVEPGQVLMTGVMGENSSLITTARVDKAE